MKRKCGIAQIGGVVVAMLIGLPVSLSAQGGGAVANPQFVLKKVDVDNLKTPDFNIKSTGAARNTENWGQIQCEFVAMEPKNGWLDNVQLKWNVLIMDAKVERLVLTRTIDYVDVLADGRESQHAVVYIPPRKLMRFYEKSSAPQISNQKLSVFIEVFVDGVKVGEMKYPERGIAGVPDGWWNSRQVNRIPGGLLARRDSPFACLDDDFWCTEKPLGNPQ